MSFSRMGSHSNNHNNDDYYGGLSPETFSPLVYSRERNIFCRLEIKSMAAKREKRFPTGTEMVKMAKGCDLLFFSRLSRRVVIVTHPVFNQFLLILPRFSFHLDVVTSIGQSDIFTHWATI